MLAKVVLEMPQIFSIGSYVVYFWSDEGEPKEPVHVHVAQGRPQKNGTKIWITKSMHCIVAHNKSKIPMHVLNDIMPVIEVRALYICTEWKKHFEEISFYC